MQKITPFLWFNDNAQEAMNFYVSIFKNSRIVSVNRSGGTFEFDGQEFIAFNGGPHFTFTPAISLFVNWETKQEEEGLGRNFLRGEKNKDAGGLRTNMVCHGRSFPVF